MSIALKPNAIILDEETVLDLVRDGLLRRGIPNAPNDVLWLDHGRVLVNHAHNGDVYTALVLKNLIKERGPTSFWEAVGRCGLDVETAERAIDDSKELVWRDRTSDDPIVTLAKRRRR